MSRRLLTSWFPSRRIAALEAEVRTLTGERDTARDHLDTVIAQRDELRRVIGNVRSYARQEAQKIVGGHVHVSREVLGDQFKPDRVAMRPTVALAAHLRDPEPVTPQVDLSACYHPAEDSSMEGFWHRCHGSHEPCQDTHG